MPTTANMDKVNGIVISGTPAPTDRHILLGTQTASSSATLSFSGINSHRSDVLRSSFDVLEFRFDNMHPATNGVEFSFQVNTAGASGFNETITSTVARMYTDYDNSSKSLAYRTGTDQAQGTAYQKMTEYTSSDNDSGVAGVLTLYAPSSTTYVKQFMLTTTDMYDSTSLSTFHIGGYINITAAIDEISFKMSSGNIDAGVIKMYGIAKA